MTLLGYQFDKMKVTPEADSALYNALGDKRSYVVAGYKNGLNLTASGLNIYVDSGAAIVCGRYVEVTDQESLSVVANTSGYICLTVDLTETNTATGTPGSPDYEVINNQFRLELLQELTQQDLFKDGQVYTFPIGTYTSNGTSTSIAKNRKSYSNAIYDEVVLYNGITSSFGIYFDASQSYSLDPSRELVELRLLWSRYQVGGTVLNYGGKATIIAGSDVRDYQSIGHMYREIFQYGVGTGQQTFKNIIFNSNGIVGNDDNAGTPSGGNDNRNIVLRKVVAVYRW